MATITLTEFFKDYYKPLRLRGRSANTVRLYGNTVKQFGKFLGRAPTLEDLSDLTMSRYLDHRCADRSVFTAEKERSQLFAMWRCAADRRLIEYRPTLQVTQMPTRIPTAWSIEQLKSLLATAKVATGNIGDVPARVFWPALILVLWQSAERIGAIMACRKSDYVRPRLLVRAEYRKGGKRDKLYTFTDPVCDLLDVLASSGKSEALFNWTKNREYMWPLFGKLIEQAGLPAQKKARFHQLRRSAATHFTASGGDAVALLDHSNPKTTKAYLDPRFIDTGPKPCDVLPEIG
jgi:site-specific recombinase XerD